MYKKLFILLACGFLGGNTGNAQNKGILPFSGMRYFKEGIWARSIDVRIDGDQLLGNRVPYNKEIEISLLEPTGFTSDKKKIVYVGAEYTLLSAKGEVLLTNPNLFLLKESTGFAPKDLKTLSMKFGIAEQMIKVNGTGTIKIRLYDLKGKNQLRLEFPISIGRPREAVQVSKTVKAIKSPVGSTLMVSGLSAKAMLVTIDTTIKTNPKRAYASLDITNIEGTDLMGVFQGKESFWVYDNDLNEIKIPDILLKQVKGQLESNNIGLMLKVPYRLKTEPLKNYIIRYRWDSADKSQVIDAAITK